MLDGVDSTCTWNYFTLDAGATATVRNSTFAGAFDCGQATTSVSGSTLSSLTINGGAPMCQLSGTTLTAQKWLVVNNARGEDLRELLGTGRGNAIADANAYVEYTGTVSGGNTLYALDGNTGYYMSGVTVAGGAALSSIGQSVRGYFNDIRGEVDVEGGSLSLENTTTVNSGGSLTVRNAGVHRGSGGSLRVNGGGTLVLDGVNSTYTGGYLTLDSGSAATVRDSTFAGGFTSYGNIVCSNTTFGGQVTISGGIFTDTGSTFKGKLSVSGNTEVSLTDSIITDVNGISLAKGSELTLENVNFVNHAKLTVADGATLNINQSNGFTLVVEAGAFLNLFGYTVVAEEMLNVLDNCSANDIHVESAGEIRVKGGGKGSAIELESGAYLFAESGASLSDVFVSSGAYIEIADGATAENISLGTGVFVAGIVNEGETPLVIGKLSGEQVIGDLKNGTISGTLRLGDGANVSGLSGNFMLEIADTFGNYAITGNDFSQVTLELGGDGVIDLSGNYWGTTDIDSIYERLGVDSTMVRIDDVLGRNPNAAVFALESTNLNKNYLAPNQTSISFIFNALLDETTISTNSIVFVSTSGKSVAIRKTTVQGNMLTVEFDELMAEGVYTIRLADSIRDMDGNALTSIRNDNLAAGIGEQLRIMARLSGASVVKVSPAGDIAGTLTIFRVYFNKSVNPTTLLDNVKLIVPNGSTITPTSMRMLNDSTAEFTVSAQTAAGKYSVQVSPNVADYAGTPLDQNGNGIVGEADDGFASMFTLTEIDLSIKNVQVAEKLTVGENATITWKVANESSMALMGSWTDGVYLSTDARWDIGDTLLATYTHENGLNAGETLSGEASLNLLGVKEGSYYLLVRSDIYNDENAGIADSIAAQNLVATRIMVEVPLLTLGETATGSFAASGDFATYHVQQRAGEALQFELDSDIDAANLVIYVGYGQAPSREQYDAKLQRITDATLTIDAGIVSRDVYILVYAKSTPEAFDYTLSARKAPASIEKIAQSGQDGSEAITLTITGKNFTNGMIARLLASDGTAIALDNVRLLGTTKLTATIVADTLTTGDYILELVDDDDTVTADQLVTISETAGEGKLEHSFYAPSVVGRHANHTLYLTVSNAGTAAIDAPLVFFTPTQSHANGTETMGAILSLRYDLSAFWVSTIPAGYSDSLSFFVNGETSGTIQPDESISVPIYYTGWRTDDWDFGDSHINWNVSVLYANDGTPLQWSDVFHNIGLSFTTEQELAQAFSAEFGDTWGGYYEMVVGNLRYLDEIEFTVGTVDTSSMLRFEAMQKAGILQPFHNLAESEDLVLTGSTISIQRTYDIGQGTMEENCSFGYGWGFNWDVRLTTISSGDVQIVQGNTRRLYQPTATFGYQTVSKDGSSLKNNATGYRLTDTDGSQWQFDTDGRLLYVIEKTGERISCAYNADGLLVRLTNTSTGGYVSFVRDAETGLITVTKDSTGRSISYAYSEDGDLVSVTDSVNGLVASYEYYASIVHALTKVTDGNGAATAYAYDTLGRVVSIANVDGSTTLAYGTAGDVTLTSGDAQITIYYAPNGNIVKIINDKTGKVYNYTYDSNGAFVSGKDSDGNALTAQFTFAGQTFDVMYSGVDFSGITFNAIYNTNINTNHYVVDGVTYYKTDGDGNILRQNDLADEYYVSGYDENGNIVSYEYLKDGITMTYVFAEDGSYTVALDDPSQYFVIDGIKYFRKDMEGNVLGQYDTDVDSYTMGYDATGNRVFYACTRDGETTSYQYDVNGNIISVTDANGTTIYTYDADGNKMTETAPDGTLSCYDSNGNLTSRTNAEGKVISYAYDVNGNLASITSDGLTVLYNYDAEGNLLGYTDERGNVYAYAYDTEGRQTSVTVNGKTTCYAYDANGNYSSITDPNGNTSLYNYNADGLLLQFTDANGNVTTYTYNDDNALTRITFTDGTFEAYAYNTDGELTGWTGRAGQSATYTVDANGNYTGVIYSDGQENTFTYNTNGYLLSANDIAFTYDAEGNLTAQSFTDGRSIQYTYKADGYVVRYVDELGHEVNYTYTANGQYDVLSNETGGLIIDYDYDINGYLVKAAYGNGTYTTYAYDDYGQVTAIDNYGSDGTVNSFVHYVYDSEGKRISMTTADGTWAYTYDAKDQLIGAAFTDKTGVVTQEFACTYDAMGNRLTVTENGVTTTYTYNELNQIVSANGFAYRYDANGNLLEDEKRIYTWTADNRVSTETVKSTGQTWKYGYDALGNRISSTTNGVTTSWTIDANGNVLSEYVDGIWNRAYYQGNLLTGFIDKDGNEYYYNADALGTTVSVTGTDGSVINTYTYDPWGNVLNSVEEIANDFTFVGGYGLMQNDSGTYFVRARNYDSQTGRWISPDPIGINGGENLYVYVSNNPISKIDYSGLICPIHGGGTFGEYIKEQLTKEGLKAHSVIDLVQTIASPVGEFLKKYKLPYNSDIVSSLSTIISQAILGSVYKQSLLGASRGAIKAAIVLAVSTCGWVAGAYFGGAIGGFLGSVVPVIGNGVGIGIGIGVGGMFGTGFGAYYGGKLADAVLDEIFPFICTNEPTCPRKIPPIADASATESIQPINRKYLFAQDDESIIYLNASQSFDESNQDKHQGIFSYIWYVQDSEGVWKLIELPLWEDFEPIIKHIQKIGTSVNYALSVVDYDDMYNTNGTTILVNGKIVNVSTVTVTIKGINPIANAGISQTYSAKDGEMKTFTLDASKSMAVDGRIAEYVWYYEKDGERVYWQTTTSAKVTDSLRAGESRKYLLSVYDDAGIPSMNTASVVITIGSDISTSTDPNDKTVSEGVGEAGYVQAGATLSYTIEFENDPEFATAPAQWVRVFDTLDGSKYDLDSFELQEFCIAGNTFVVGDGRDSFNRTVELAILDYTITATISINLVTDEDMGITQLVAEFMAVDPESGFMLQDLENGLLPVNDAFGSGQGHISYIINALDDLPSGMEITNTAKIYFDFNDPINTPTTLNTIDADAPSAVELDVSADDNGLVIVAMNSTDTSSGVVGYNLRWSTDGEQFADYGYTTYSQLQLSGLSGMTYYFQAQAIDAVGLVSEWSAIQAVTVGGVPTGLSGNTVGLSWKAVAGAETYVVEYSTDDFTHFVRIQVAGTSLDSFRLPLGSYRWRVRAAGQGEWQEGEPSVSVDTVNVPTLLQSNDDKSIDVFFGKTNAVWNGNYQAQHVGVGAWKGTNEIVELDGKNQILDVFAGSDDASILLMTDDENGDALFIDDIYSAFPEGLDAQARIAKIDEIRAGDGDDIVDLTSQRFDYIGGGMTVKGGLGDDVIWANDGDNMLFGDAGNDRIVGAGGNDVIVGGAGDDSMHGGGGEDIFAFGGNWGNDNVEQLAGGKVTLWFEDGSLENWNEASLTYQDGENSVKVSGVMPENVTLKFGDDGSEQYSKLLEAGAFDEFSSERIFENRNTRGMLA